MPPNSDPNYVEQSQTVPMPTNEPLTKTFTVPDTIPEIQAISIMAQVAEGLTQDERDRAIRWLASAYMSKEEGS